MGILPNYERLRILHCYLIAVQTLTNEELESKIKEFIETAEKFDERYRHKIFEVLLAEYLSSLKAPERVAQEAEITIPAPVQQTPSKFVIPIDVRAFLQQYGIPEDKIQNIFVIDGENIRPTYHIKTTAKSEAQIQVALLTALENALRPGGRFEFSMEAVRQRCKDEVVYDAKNFSAHFKNNIGLFKSLKDEEHVELSPDGKAELADAILAITE